MLAEGRLVNLGCATGHPSFVMSNSFTNQTLAQIELWKEKTPASTNVVRFMFFQKNWMKKVAALHLKNLGVELTVLSKEQADYIGVNVNSPYKPAIPLLNVDMLCQCAR